MTANSIVLSYLSPDYQVNLPRHLDDFVGDFNNIQDQTTYDNGYSAHYFRDGLVITTLHSEVRWLAVEMWNFEQQTVIEEEKISKSTCMHTILKILLRNWPNTFRLNPERTTCDYLCIETKKGAYGYFDLDAGTLWKISVHID